MVLLPVAENLIADKNKLVLGPREGEKKIKFLILEITRSDMWSSCWGIEWFSLVNSLEVDWAYYFSCCLPRDHIRKVEWKMSELGKLNATH